MEEISPGHDRFSIYEETHKSSKLLKSFVQYCEAHPEERFWQALRNWCGWPFVWVSTCLIEEWGGFEKDDMTFADTFYWEENKRP